MLLPRLTVANDLSIRAGNGGNGGGLKNVTNNSSATLFAGNGGIGGNAQLDATGKDVVVGGTLSVISGNNGNAGTGTNVSGTGLTVLGLGGMGGDATFTAGTLTAPTINLTKNDGALSFTADTLLVNQNTIFTMNQGSIAGNFDVSINGLSFSGGSSLTITRMQGTETMAFGGNLFVSGTGNSLNSPIAFDASGKTITFNLLTNIAAGDVLLSSNGSSIKLTGVMSS